MSEAGLSPVLADLKGKCSAHFRGKMFASPDAILEWEDFLTRHRVTIEDARQTVEELEKRGHTFVPRISEFVPALREIRIRNAPPMPRRGPRMLTPLERKRQEITRDWARDFFGAASAEDRLRAWERRWAALDALGPAPTQENLASRGRIRVQLQRQGVKPVAGNLAKHVTHPIDREAARLKSEQAYDDGVPF